MREELENIKVVEGNAALLKNMKTIVCEYEEKKPLISYFTDGVTLQYITGNAEEHSYMDNLEARGIQSALGYSNVLLDLHTAIWPQAVDDEWQNIYDTMSSNVHTYWNGRGGFEETTLSESDMRIRTLLNLDYQDGRNEDTIVLQVSNAAKPAWFVLRTHAEKIVEIRGGEYQELEKNVYLIKVLEDTVEIEVEQLSLQEQVSKY